MFSDAELQMACDPEVILTKNRIIEKVYQAFGDTAHNLLGLIEPLREILPDETLVMPKISKGEQYRGLPWVMLDYPRVFDHEKGHLAIRVMFLWGNYFLVQLHISGKYLLPVLKKTKEWVNKGEFSEDGWLMGFPDDPWDFIYPQQGLGKADALNWPEAFSKSGIFKIVKKQDLGLGWPDGTTEKMAVLLREAFAG
jgi:hypothetical protein